MLTPEEIEQAANEHIRTTCSSADVQAVKDYAKEDFLAGVKFAMKRCTDICTDEMNELIEVMSNFIDLNEIDNIVSKKQKKFIK